MRLEPLAASFDDEEADDEDGAGMLEAPVTRLWRESRCGMVWCGRGRTDNEKKWNKILNHQYASSAAAPAAAPAAAAGSAAALSCWMRLPNKNLNFPQILETKKKNLKQEGP